jgi:hypothetical protein
VPHPYLTVSVIRFPSKRRSNAFSPIEDSKNNANLIPFSGPWRGVKVEVEDEVEAKQLNE